MNMGMKFGTKEISDYDISSLFGDNSGKMTERHKERTNHHSRLTVSSYIRNASGRIAKGMKVSGTEVFRVPQQRETKAAIIIRLSEVK